VLTPAKGSGLNQFTQTDSLMPDHQPKRPHDPEHDHTHSRLSETELRVRGLESVLTQKGYVDPAALDLLIETYEKKSALTTEPAW
jgi:hypothetical protein